MSNESNGHGVLIFGADGKPAGGTEFARAAAVQHAVNELLKNDRNLQSNFGELHQTLVTFMAAFNQLVDRVAELELRYKVESGE